MKITLTAPEIEEQLLIGLGLSGMIRKGIIPSVTFLGEDTDGGIILTRKIRITEILTVTRAYSIADSR